MLLPGVLTERKRILAPPAHHLTLFFSLPSPLPYNITDPSLTHTLDEKSSGISDEF